MTIAKRCLVSGRVQGVFYRASTQLKARELGVHGYAKNLADGRVEVLALGDRQSVEALIEWLWQGSSTSHVTSVEVVELTAQDIGQIPSGFATR
jgi:acylphosphatase